MPKLHESTSSWTCEVCTLTNPVRRRRCQACESRRPVVDPEQQQRQQQDHSPPPNFTIDGVGTEESGSSSPTEVSASSRSAFTAATATTATTVPESASAANDDPNNMDDAPLVSDWLRRRRSRKRRRTSCGSGDGHHNRQIHVTLRVNDGMDAFEPLLATIHCPPVISSQEPHSPLATPTAAPAASDARPTSPTTTLHSSTKERPALPDHGTPSSSDSAAVVAATAAAATQQTTSPSSFEDQETDIISISPRKEESSVTVAQDVQVSPPPPENLQIAHSYTDSEKTPQSKPPPENLATALGDNTAAGLRRDATAPPGLDFEDVSIDSGCGGAAAEARAHDPKPNNAIFSLAVRTTGTIPDCCDRNAMEATEDGRPGPRGEDSEPAMEEESSSYGESDATEPVAAAVPGPQSTLLHRMTNALSSPIPENKHETAQTDQTQTQRLEASPCIPDIPVASATLAVATALQEDDPGSPTLLHPPGPASPQTGTLASDDRFSFVYTQVSSQELESSQDNLSQERKSSRSPSDRTSLPSAKPESIRPCDLLRDAEQQETVCTNHDAGHTALNQCSELVTAPPSAQLNRPAVHSPSHEAESEPTANDPPSTINASYPPMFTTAGHRRPIHVSESELDRVNQSWDSLESSHSAGAPPPDQGSRGVGQRGWRRPPSCSVPPRATSDMFPRSLGKRSMDTAKSTPTLFRPSSHCEPKDSIPFAGKSNLTATGFQTAGLGETLSVPERSLTRADALFRDESNIDPPAAKEACSVETHTTNGMSSGRPPSPAVSYPSLRKNDSAAGGCDIDECSATERTHKPLFATAGLGRGVVASAQGLARANALWIDQANNAQIERSRVSIPDQQNLPPNFPGDIRSSVPTVESSFQGFATAGKGRTVTVSDETLARASALLGEQGDNFETPALTRCLSRVSVSDSKRPGLLPSSDPTYVRTRGGSATSTGPAAFATAGQRSVLSVTAESMARASALLEGRKEEFQTPAPPRHSHLVSLLDASTDLSSGASSERTTSCPPANEPHWLPSPANEPTGLPRFATAGNGRLVTTSAESVARAISLLADNAVDFQTPAPPQRAPRVSFTDAKWPVSIPTAESHRDLGSRRFQAEDSTEVFGLAALGASCRGRFSSGSSHVTKLANTCSREPLGTFDTPIAPMRATRVSFADSGKIAPSPTSFETLVGPKDPTTEGSFNDDDLRELSAAEEKQAHSTYLDGAEHARALRCECFSAYDACERLREDETETVGSRFGFSVEPGASENHVCNEGNATIFTEHGKDSIGIDGRGTGFHGAEQPVGLESIVSRVSSLNATSVRFDVISKRPCHLVSHKEAFSNVVGDLPDYRAAIGDLGVDATMIEDKWILNHVRWIVWKLASLDRHFQRQELGSSLTFDAVVKRLKARHNREFLKGERSPLRKVLNRDVSSLTMMILCVARVVLSEQQTRESLALELTDGWYSVRASIDIPLRDFISKGTIKVGSKLLVSNSTLVGCEDGVDPLDASFDAMNEDSSPTLCISANGSRLAKWDSKLGFVRPTMVLKEAGGLLQIGRITDILQSGGRIPLIELTVLRKYPILYRGSNSNGSPSRAADSEPRFRIYTEQENEERVRCREKKREKFVEGIVDEVEAECMKELDQGAPELWQRFLGHHDPESFLANIDIRDKVALETWMERRSLLMQGRRQQEIEARLEELEDENDQVTPFIRVLVQSAVGDNTLAPVPVVENLNETAMLTVWNPTDEQIEAIRDGNTLRIKNLGVGNNRYDGLLQLMANGRTSIMVSSTATAPTRTGVCDVPKLILLSRRDLEMSRPTKCAWETDLLGIVLSISNSHEHSCWAVAITDVSGLLVRVHILHAKGIAAIQHLGISSPDLPNSFSVVMFRQIRVLPFDLKDGCGVADFLGTSALHVLTDCPRTKVLLQWANSDRGVSRIACLLSRLNARIPGRQSSAIVAFGFIVELCLLSVQQLFVKVDCSGGDIHTWKFPLSLMPKFLSIAEDSSDYVVLNSQEEKRLASLMNVGLAFRSRRDLYRFQLQQSAAPLSDGICSSFEVVDISPTTQLDSLTNYFLRNA